MSNKITLASKIKLLSGQHIEAINCNTMGKGIPYLTGPSDFYGKTPIATKYTEHPKVCCKKEDILITVKGSGTGSIAIADREYCISRQLMAIRCQDIHPTFIQYLLEQNERIFNAVAAGLIPGISRVDVLKLRIPNLTFPEQTAIAYILATWDTAINKTERLIEAKEKRKKDLAHKLLFGKARTAKRKTAGFLEKPWFAVPNDWCIVKIGAVASEVSIKNHNGNSIPVLSCTKYQGLVDSLKYFDKQIFSKDTSTYKVVEQGQFAYATNHIEEGSIGYQNIYPKGLVSPMYTVFKTNQKKVNDGYLYKLFKTETLRHMFDINTSASVDRRGSLRWTEFSKLPIPLPTLSEQTEINEILDTVQLEIDLLKKQAEAYRKQKRGLMQKLLTGKWRIKSYGGAHETSS